jgi:hypothetical protein
MSMSKEQAEIKIKAAAYAVAAELGWQQAAILLKKVADELQTAAWKDR